MFLEKIVPVKEQEVEQTRRRLDRRQGEKAAAMLPPCRDLYRALTQSRRGLGLMAEVKKASPSKGLIREDFRPGPIAEAYERGGADAISVLTDVSFFQGSVDYLQTVKEAVALPVFRKDFIIDEIQVLESRLCGADALLLIAAILTDERMKQLSDYSAYLGLQVLIEVHNEAELERTLRLQPRIIGINNRDLHTFQTDLATTERLIGQVPQGVAVVSESGFNHSSAVRRMREIGASAILVGEHLMRQEDIASAVVELMRDV